MTPVRNILRRFSQSLSPLLQRNSHQIRLFSTTNAKFSDNEDDLEDNSTVVVEKDEAFKVMSIGINRPEKRNCVNKETADKLYEAFADFEADENINCAVLHGVGGNFCAGYDLSELASLEDDNIANMIANLMIDRGPMGPTRMDFRKPVIAAITGYCVAGGLELALMCDLRVMEETAKVGFLNRRFGVPLIDGGSVRLPELIGLSRANDLIITGRIVEAKEAANIGLVNRMCRVGTAYGTAMTLAREISAVPQECMRADRASAYHATFASQSLEGSLQFESENAVHVISQESLVGAQKFVKGLGRHGKFNVTPMAEPEDWEKEHAEMQKEATAKDTDKEKMS